MLNCPDACRGDKSFQAYYSFSVKEQKYRDLITTDSLHTDSKVKWLNTHSRVQDVWRTSTVFVAKPDAVWQ